MAEPMRARLVVVRERDKHLRAECAAQPGELLTPPTLGDADVLGHLGCSGETRGGLRQDAVHLEFQPQVAVTPLLQGQQLRIGDQVVQRRPPDLPIGVEWYGYVRERELDTRAAALRRAQRGLQVQQPPRFLGDLRDADLQLNLEDMCSHPLEDPYAFWSNVHAVAPESFLEPQLIHDGESSAMV